MSHAKTLSLSLSLSLISLAACDSSDIEQPPAERGLGETVAQIEVLVASSEPSPATLGLDAAPTPEPSTTNSSPGLPSRDQDLVGWIQWSGALPYYAGPIFDETGEQCGEGQAGSVWYLPGTAGGPAERSCTIPVGKQVVFPLLNYYGAVPESYYPTPEDEQAYIDGFAETSAFIFNDITCSLSATLDGQPLYDDLSATWVDVFEPFEVELPDDPDNFADWYGLVGGTTPAVGSGYYARTPPLSPGVHTLEFGGTLCFEGEVWFETHASYTLTVVPPNQL